MIKAFKFRAQAIFSLLEKTHTPPTKEFEKFFSLFYIISTQISYIHQKLDTNSCFAKLRANSYLFSFSLHPVDCIQCDINSPSDQAFCTFLVGSKQKSVKFKLDTGSQVNILPKSIYKSLGGYVESLDRPNETLSAYNNNRLESLGCCHLKCVHQKGKYTNESTLAFHVVGNRSPALTCDWLS